jgi:hypothetical protein
MELNVVDWSEEYPDEYTYVKGRKRRRPVAVYCGLRHKNEAAGTYNDDLSTISGYNSDGSGTVTSKSAANLSKYSLKTGDEYYVLSAQAAAISTVPAPPKTPERWTPRICHRILISLR